MPNYHNIELKGHVGRDPELRYTKTGKAVIGITVAVTPKKGMDPIWYRCTAWEDKATEIAAEFKKGDCIHVKRGIPKTETWVDKEGVTHANMNVSIWEYDKLFWDDAAREYRADKGSYPTQRIEPRDHPGPPVQPPEKPYNVDADVPF